MFNLGKSPVFNGNLRTLEGTLRVFGEDFVYSLTEIPAAQRPEGFRFSKHVTVLKATSGDFQVQGAGESQTSGDESFEKAKSEVLERLCLEIQCARTEIADTSSGWAGHYETRMARENAALELFERDSVLVQWFRSASLVEIEPRQLPFLINWWKWSELALSEFPQLSIMITTEGYFPAVVALLKNKNGNAIVGTAASTNLARAIDSAIAEACRSAHHFIRGTFQHQVEALLQGQDFSPRPGAHTVLYAKSQKLPDWFVAPIKKIGWREASEGFDSVALAIAIQEAKIEFAEIAYGDRCVVKAHSSKLQKIFWGSSLNGEHLNFERINRNVNSINQLPHLVG
jgi:hypothetical protein